MTVMTVFSLFFIIAVWQIPTSSVAGLFLPDFGLCPGGIVTMRDFDMAQAQVPGLLTPSKCGRQVFGRYDDGSVSVHNTGTMDIGVGLVVELCGVAKGRSPLIKGEFITRFPLMNEAESPDYRILDTDYSSYAAVYSCDDFLFEKAEIGIILTRDPIAPQSTIDRGLNAFRRSNISMTFERAEQSGSCVYETSSYDSCSREQFPSNVVGEVLSTMRLSKNTMIRAVRAIIGLMQAV